MENLHFLTNIINECYENIEKSWSVCHFFAYYAYLYGYALFMNMRSSCLNWQTISLKDSSYLKLRRGILTSPISF